MRFRIVTVWRVGRYVRVEDSGLTVEAADRDGALEVTHRIGALSGLGFLSTYVGAEAVPLGVEDVSAVNV